MLEVTTEPPGLLDPAVVDPSRIDAGLDAARSAGVRTVTVAAHPIDDATDALLDGAGFRCVREMLQLRRPLPADPPAPEVTVRPFDPERDTHHWLEVNRRAFAWHPDQGTWGASDLARRLAEPWFDPAGFLVHDAPDRSGIDGFCWTKVHAAKGDEPPLGEIFVIGVDPDAHGRGLGRAMVLAGLDHLHRHGIDTAMLFVEADNVVGRQLYDTLGFARHEVHRWYRLDLADH